MAVYKHTRTVIATPCTQGSEITVSLSAGQAVGTFSSVGISTGYQTQRQFWAAQISALPGKILISFLHVASLKPFYSFLSCIL